MNNLVAKHAHKYNKHVVHRDKTKVRPPKKLTTRELDDYYQERDYICADLSYAEVHRRDSSV